MATESEAMVPDPRTSWAVPLSLEATAKALGGMRKPLMREREYGSSTVRVCSAHLALLEIPGARSKTLRGGEVLWIPAGPNPKIVPRGKVLMIQFKDADAATKP